MLIPKTCQFCGATLMDGETSTYACGTKEMGWGVSQSVKCQQTAAKHGRNLENWKKEATEVFSKIDFQSIGKLLNIGLGQDVASQIEPKIKELLAEIDKLQEHKRILLALAFDFQDRADAISEKARVAIDEVLK